MSLQTRIKEAGAVGEGRRVRRGRRRLLMRGATVPSSAAPSAP